MLRRELTAAEIAVQKRNDLDFVYKKYAPVIYGLISTHFPERAQCNIVFKDVFVRTLSTIGNYDPAKSRLFTWIYWIASEEIQKEKAK